MFSYLFNTIISSKKHINDQTLLVLGCGHKHNGCRYIHTNDHAWTIDINSDIKPDSVCDASKTIPKEIEQHKFNVLILEFFPVKFHNAAISLFQSLLKEDGYIIIAGAAVADVNLLQNYAGFYYEYKNVLILTAKNNTQKALWWQQQELNDYLKSLGVNESDVPHFIQIGDTQKQFCHLPDTFYQPITIPEDKTWERFITLHAELNTHVNENNSFLSIVNSIVALNQKMAAEVTPSQFTYKMLLSFLDCAREKNIPGLFSSPWGTMPIQLYKTIANTKADIEHFENATINDEDREVIWDLVNKWGDSLCTLPYGLYNQGRINEVNAVMNIIMLLLISDKKLFEQMKPNLTNKPHITLE